MQSLLLKRLLLKRSTRGTVSRTDRTGALILGASLLVLPLLGGACTPAAPKAAQGNGQNAANGQELPVSSTGIQFTDYHEKVLLDPAAADGPALTLDFTLPVPQGNDQFNALITTLAYTGQKPADYWTSAVAAHTKEYRNQNPAATKQPSETLNWEIDEKWTQTATTPALVLCRTEYAFEGGAHGKEMVTYFVIDPVAMRQFALTDLVRQDPALTKAVETALQQQYAPGGTLTSAGFFTDTLDTVPANFFVTPDGIGFHWDQYDIAPGSLGNIDVILPVSAVKAYLTPQGKALFGLN